MKVGKAGQASRI